MSIMDGSVPPPLEFVTLAQVKARAPELSEDEAVLLHGELNAAIRSRVPCLVAAAINPDVLIQAQGIALRSLERHGAVRSWVARETIGPYSADYRDNTATSSILSGDDLAALRSLCGGAPVGGMPVGSFPQPDRYGHLFATPPRWRQA